MSNKKTQYLVDATGLIGMGLLCLSYVMFSRTFAEFAIQVSFLDFPVFVGEIFLFLCGALFLMKILWGSKLLTKKTAFLLMIYGVFVLTKAALGYQHYGPLALRNAALFYYPFFGLCAYCFYRQDFFDATKTLLLSLFIINIFALRLVEDYWILVLVFLAVILIKAYPLKYVRWALLMGLALSVPYKKLIQTSRMMIVGNIAGVGVVCLLLYRLVDWPKNQKRAWALSILAGAGIFIATQGDSSALASLWNLKKLAQVFAFYDGQVQQRLSSPDYRPRVLKQIGLYHSEVDVALKAIEDRENRVQAALRKRRMPGRSKTVDNKQEDVSQREDGLDSSKSSGRSGRKRMNNELRRDLVRRPDVQEKPVQAKRSASKQVERQGSSPTVARTAIVEKKLNPSQQQRDSRIKKLNPPQQQRDSRIKKKKACLEAMKAKAVSVGGSKRQKNKKDQGETPRGRSFEGALNNSVFRLLIWRDMTREFLNANPRVWGAGFSFGKPLRSHSLEVLGWGESEWGRDGWIGAHNSWLHMIYRAGLIGLVFIVVVLGFLGRMMNGFLRKRSVTGILLCGILVDLFVAANFLLVLELPYTAVPIWVIYGLTAAYYRDLLADRKKEAPTHGG